MKILLLGEYSNVHATLARGLTALGHDVTVVSDGDTWKGYPRDIDLRRSSLSPAGTLRYLGRVARVWWQLRGYDVVQIINPMFLTLKAERIMPFYRMLRRRNGHMVMGAFGIDHYWVRVGMDATAFRYSDFHIGGVERHSDYIDTMKREWLTGPKGRLNMQIAADCDAIVSGLYENDVCYRPFFAEKTTFIPFPIDMSAVTPTATLAHVDRQPRPVHFFIGIQRERTVYKGTDIMLRALMRLEHDCGQERVVVHKAESVPFAQYQDMMNSSHVMLDQLYSYTPAMNALLAMAKGLVVVGGGEEEHYALMGEQQLRPVVNVWPSEDDVYDQIRTRLLSGTEDVHQLQLDSQEYVRRHHDHVQVARSYEALYQSLS